MEIHRNENPFDKPPADTMLEAAPEIRQVDPRLVTLIAVGLAGVLIINICLSVILFKLFVRNSYPFPINHNSYNIDYSFDDEHLIAVTNMAAPYVVAIKMGGTEASGVIFDFDDKGRPYILTNNHVIKLGGGKANDYNLTVKLYGSAVFSDVGMCEVVGVDAYNDIAVIRLNYSNWLQSFVDSVVKPPDYCVVDAAKNVVVNYKFEAGNGEWGDALQMGARVLAIGNPFGKGLAACEGIIAAPLAYVKYDGNSQTNSCIQVTAPINSGNSGGGLFDMKGQLIGIVSARLSNGDNIGYAIPVELAFSIAYRLIGDYTGGGAAEFTVDNAMTCENLALAASFVSDVGGLRETVYLWLNKTNSGTAPFWNPKDLTYNVRITELAGVRFEGDVFNELMLAHKKLLLLKVDCLLYSYRHASGGSPLTIRLADGSTEPYIAYNVTR